MPQIAVDANGNKVRWDEKKKSWVPVEKASDASGNVLEFDGAKWNPVSVGMNPVAGEQKTAGQSAKEKIIEQISGGKFQIPFTAPDLGTEPIWTSPVFKKDYWGQVGTGSYWSETYRNLKRAATDMEPMGAYAKTMGKTLAMKLTRKQWDKKYGDKAREEYARQVDPDTAEKIWPSTGEVVGGAFKGLGKGAVDFALWMPRTAYNLVRDPLTTIHDDPLGAIFLLSGVSGGAKKLWNKHRSGKPILPKELKALEPELKKWALENKDNAQRYLEMVEAAQKRADLAKDMSVQKEQMGPEIPGAFPETRRKTGLSPRSVRGPEIPEEAANIAARQQPVPVGPVAPGPMKVAPAQEFGGEGFNRIMAGPEVVSGPGVEWGSAANHPTMPTPPKPTSKVPKIKTEVPVKPEAPQGTGAPSKPLDLTSSQMKMGLDEFDNLKKAYAGFPILDENLQKYIKSGRLIVGPAQDAKTGAKVPVPAKIVGMGDFKTDIPRYTSTPRDKSIVEPFKIEKTAGGIPGGMPGYKHELESLLKQKDMPATAVKHEYENPVRWFDSSPFLKESLYYPWREADHGHMLEKIGYRAVVDSWKRNITGANWRRAERDLGAYAIAKQKNGPETLQLMGIDPADVVSRVEANPSMMKVYGEARGYLETMFTRINKAREILGMPPLPKVENYFTFARGVTDLSAMGVNPVTISDPAMIKRHLYEPTFQYKSRENVIGPMSTKFFGIFEHYINSASKYTLYAPVVAKGRMMLGDWAINDSIGRPAGNFNLRDTAPNLSNMVSEWVDRIAGKKLTTNKAFSKALGALARNTGTSVIAFNPRSTLIQPTSLANTYIEVGAKNLLKGMEEYALKENRQLAMRESMVLKGRAMDFHLEDLWADGVAGAINKGRSKASAVGTYPLRALDAMSAQVSWLSAVEKGKQLGLEGKELYRYADDIVVRTQASAKIGDVARIQTTPLGKLATIFQTFVINNWNYWSKDVFGWKNPGMATADRVRRVSRLILSSVIINSLFEDVLGINSPLPAPEREIVEGIRRGDTPGQIGVNVAKEVGESVPFFGGAIKYTSDKYQSYPPVVQQGVDVAKLWSSVQKAINKKDIKAFTIKDWETASKILGIPGGGVAANMYKKAQAGMPWWKIIVGAPSQKQESSYPRYLQR